MTKQPTKIEIAAKIVRKVVKNENDFASESCDSLVISLPVSTSTLFLSNRAWIRSVKTVCDTEPSPTTLIDETLPGLFRRKLSAVCRSNNTHVGPPVVSELPKVTVPTIVNFFGT